MSGQEFVCLGNIKAPTIASALFDNWCCRYGTPDRFHSDGATNVHGEVLKELCKHFGVDKSKSSRLHPQGDGMAESFVKQAKSCIQKQVEKNGSDWDLFLQTTAFAIRSNTTYNTKCSPAELIFGEKLIQPIGHLMDYGAETFGQKQGSAFAKELKSRIESCKKMVNSHLAETRKQMKKRYDKGSKPSPFSIGDTVMLWKPYKKKGVSSCFQPKWHGPWTIVKFTGNTNTNCKIVNCSDPTAKMNVHVNQLKLVKNDSRNSSYNTTQDVMPAQVSEQGKNVRKQPFLHYLEDEEYAPNVEVRDGEHQEEELVLNHQERPLHLGGQPRGHEQIDSRWVDVDVHNIVPGGRTRNNPDYNILAGNRRV